MKYPVLCLTCKNQLEWERGGKERMKLVIITGTSAGLGHSFFHQMLNKCDGLVSISRRLLPEQQEMAMEKGKELFFLQRDFSELEGLASIEEDLGQLMGQVPISEVVFINNAGVVTPLGKITEGTTDEIRESVYVNMLAPILLTRGLLNAFDLTTTRVKVVHISTGAALRVIEGWSMYCATKAGMKMFYDVLTEEYKEFPNVTFHQVNPGVMDTPMQEKIREAKDVHFPQRERYSRLKVENQLPHPNEVAARIIEELEL